ncbi:UDP-glucose 4-epimerase GalE [Cytobacillus sp. FJAT-54145]|uniref:UDP-glucose 4-epimerase n=1 Tax=Cytobacillus spartinae TaxID=3299023 RepID=A0ABW6K822_9BACI
MAILVLGGAGYIGSHAVHELIEQNVKVVVMDNLETGHKKAIHPKAKFYKGDIRDRDQLVEVFNQEEIEGVLHFAASSLVWESMIKPVKYFDNNVYGMMVLLDVMNQFNVKNIVFSSTAATYGESDVVPIHEDVSTRPTNPYGESKRMMEQIMKWCELAHGIKYVSLRYFNVAGAMRDGIIGEDHDPETHLIPIVLETALGKRKHVTIFGCDYDTKDGTCIRDYVHVDDLIQAHILALQYLIAGNESTVFNLGSNEGYSVKEIIETAEIVTGKKIQTVLGDRRLGDPPILVASSQKAKNILGWEPKKSNIEQIIYDAWIWHSKNPNGYRE